MNQIIMSRGTTGKIATSPGGTETIVWNRFSYQVIEMVGTNTSTNEKNNFYNSTVRVISIGVGDCTTKFGALCANVLDMVSLVKIQAVNSLSKIFNIQGHTIDVSDQAILL